MSDIYTTAPVPTIGESYEIGRAHGVRAEQQRIIKLLEAQCTCRTVMRNGYMGKLICPAHTHIALIKGEK